MVLRNENDSISEAMLYCHVGVRCGRMRADMEAIDWIKMEYPVATYVFFIMLGACIGSFLNVVIYRIPRGLSVGRPARSFCPQCRAAIPWQLNIPLVSWVWLRGRSACCRKPISARYWVVELVTAAMFGVVAYSFSYESLLTQLCICLWGACLLALMVMDWEQMVVHTPLAMLAGGLGVAAAAMDPQLADPTGVWDGWVAGADGLLLYFGSTQPLSGALWALVGALGGYMLFRVVALGGRLLFGRQRQSFAGAEAWHLRQVGEDIVLSVGGRDYLWTEIYSEEHTGIVLAAAAVDAAPGVKGRMVLEENALVLPDGKRLKLEDYESMSGTCEGVCVQRAAMGSGDAWLALAIGAMCGWQGVIFALVGGSIIGLVIALIMRVRRGVPMPFGPSLILAAWAWLLWGPQMMEAYLRLLGVS